jgi:hypothetical protein
MKPHYLLPFLLLSSCATVIQDHKGNVLLKTHSDSTQFSFHYKSAYETIDFDAIGLNHSRPTAVALHGATTLATGIGTGIATGILATHGANAILPALGIASATVLKPAPSPPPPNSTPAPVTK